MPGVYLHSSSTSYSIENFNGKDYTLVYMTDHNIGYTEIIAYCEGDLVTDQSLIDQLVAFKDENLNE